MLNYLISTLKLIEFVLQALIFRYHNQTVSVNYFCERFICMSKNKNFVFKIRGVICFFLVLQIYLILKVREWSEVFGRTVLKIRNFFLNFRNFLFHIISFNVIGPSSKNIYFVIIFRINCFVKTPGFDHIFAASDRWVIKIHLADIPFLANTCSPSKYEDWGCIVWARDCD